MYPVHLVGDKVVLREFRHDDEDHLLAVIGDDRVTAWLSHDSRDRAGVRATLAGAIDRRVLEPRAEYFLAVARTTTDELIGLTRLGLGGVQAAKLGYAIRADEWGNGYATDAARTLVRFGFEQLGLHRITAAIGPDNLGSIAVIERLGFEHEGRLRDHVFTNGAWRDSLLYASVTPADQPEVRRRPDERHGTGR